jgi:hypothetical protein
MGNSLGECLRQARPRRPQTLIQQQQRRRTWAAHMDVAALDSEMQRLVLQSSIARLHGAQTTGITPLAFMLAIDRALEWHAQAQTAGAALVTMSEDQDCPICVEHFLQQDLVVGLPCGHAYHAHCLYKWLTVRNSCPTCRGIGLPLPPLPQSGAQRAQAIDITDTPASADSETDAVPPPSYVMAV